MTHELIIKPTPDELIREAAQQLVGIAQNSIAARNRFSLALAGGSTPRALYELLASDAWRSHIDWAKTHIFFGDERAVATDDELSNYHMARVSLLDHIPLPTANIHRMHAEEPDLDAAARDYESQVRQFQASLDLVLLGMGDDGHTASLFPHFPAVQEQESWCVATAIAPHEPHVRRLTLTYPLLNAARNAFILVTGAGKAQTVKAALEGPPDPFTMPIQGIQLQQGRLVWMLDTPASSLLSSQ